MQPYKRGIFITNGEPAQSGMKNFNAVARRFTAAAPAVAALSSYFLT
jgi:hypothetical protein